MSEPDLDHLRALAEEATGDEWDYLDGHDGDVIYSFDEDRTVAEMFWDVDTFLRKGLDIQEASDQMQTDGAFIAATDPRTVLALIGRIEELEEAKP